jgi:hypothetical protein
MLAREASEPRVQPPQNARAAASAAAASGPAAKTVERIFPPERRGPFVATAADA